MLYVYLLLDRSGSMQSNWAETISSINGYVKELPEDSKVHIATFDNFGPDGLDYSCLRDCRKEDFLPIKDSEAFPRGGTPLYDACGKIMSIAENECGEKSILVVFTDGEENNSREWTFNGVKSRMDEWDTRGWEVVFIGAEFKAVEGIAASFGKGMGKTMNYTRGNFDKGMSALAMSSALYAAGTAINFSDEVKAAASGESV